MKQSNKTIPNNLVKFITYIAKPLYLQLLFLTFLMVILGLIPAIDSILIKFIVDNVSTTSPEELSKLMNHMLLWAACYGLWWETINISWRAYDYFYMRVIPMLKASAIDSIYNYTQYHSQRFFQINFSGNIASRITEAAKSLEYICAIGFESIVKKLVTIITSLLAAYWVHPTFAGIMIVWLTFFITVNILSASKINKYSAEYAKAHVNIVGKIVDAISNIVSIRMFRTQKYERTRLTRSLDNYVGKDRSLQWFMFKIRYIQGLSCSILIFILIYYLIKLRSQNLITIGDFGLIISLNLAIANDLWDLSQEIGDFFEYTGQLNQSLSLITPHEIIDKKDARELKITKGEIEFRNVTFNYVLNNNVFQNQSVIIPGHQKVGLVGFSGSGKTTFANLIIRLYDIKSGQILIDGQGITNVSLDSLRSQISYIPQEPVLFHRSIFENIRYGRLDATDEEVMEAAKKSYIDEFISKLPEGYSTICGERGASLSGGQRQRIAIARAILKNAPILILDEATSALDSLTENLINDSIERLMDNKTVIIIAHRLSTLLNMDRILVFDKGTIVEDGTHSKLLHREGMYYKLWDTQSGGFILDNKEKE